MKLTLVQPPALVGADNYSAMTQPPLGIAYLAAYARRFKHEVRIVDAVGEGIMKIEKWPHGKKWLVQGLSIDETVARIPKDSEVIGISCMFTHSWPLVRELIISAKKKFPNARFITGGEHVSSLYDIVLRSTPIDVCVLGEGEETLADLLAAFEKGEPDHSQIQGIAYLDSDEKTIKTCPRKRISAVDDLPWPAWDLIDPTIYMQSGVYMGPATGRSMPMLATRGCPYECTYCTSPKMWTRAWKARNPVAVVNEIERYIKDYNANDFQFQDLTAIVRKDWIIAFCKEILTRNLKISWQLPVGTRSEAIDEEVVKYLVASGCHHITYAPESGSERILKLIKKQVNLKNLEKSARASLSAGMKVCLFHVMGFPQEEMEDIQKTFKWIRHMARVGVHEITISTFVPEPGTELFHEINKTTPITLNDEYFYGMSGLSSMFTVKSWNPKISNTKLMFLKLFGLAQFYGISFLCRPSRLWKLFWNAASNRQETKVDRVIREFLIKIPRYFNFRKRPLPSPYPSEEMTVHADI